MQNVIPFDKPLDMMHLLLPPPKLHSLEKADGGSWPYKWDLKREMNMSVETLEKQLVAEGMPHILQLHFDGGEESLRRLDWSRVSWTLTADGMDVARGQGDFVLRCFERSATEFRKIPPVPRNGSKNIRKLPPNSKVRQPVRGAGGS